MKQPELGQKISALRKSKGLTQEELVDRCNISVRTIQRIETGEVNPRSYTVKTILEALESDFNTLREDYGFSKRLLRSLQWAWIAGILYFILGFPEGIMDFTRFIESSGIPESVVSDFLPVVDFGPYAYLTIKVLAVLSYLFFMQGFVSIGANFSDSFLSGVSKILMALMGAIALYDIFSLFYPTIDSILIQIAVSIVLGALSVLFGIALLKLRARAGTIGLIAGILEIVTGVLFLLLVPIALAIRMLAGLLEIIIVYQFSKTMSE